MPAKMQNGFSDIQLYLAQSKSKIQSPKVQIGMSVIFFPVFLLQCVRIKEYCLMALRQDTTLLLIYNVSKQRKHKVGGGKT